MNFRELQVVKPVGQWVLREDHVDVEMFLLS